MVRNYVMKILHFQRSKMFLNKMYFFEHFSSCFWTFCYIYWTKRNEPFFFFLHWLLIKCVKWTILVKSQYIESMYKKSWVLIEQSSAKIPIKRNSNVSKKNSKFLNYVSNFFYINSIICFSIFIEFYSLIGIPFTYSFSFFKVSKHPHISQPPRLHQLIYLYLPANRKKNVNYHLILC